MFSVSLPFKMLSNVEIDLASVGGCISPHLIAGNREIFFNEGAIAAANVRVS